MISVKGDIAEVSRYLTSIEKKQIPFAARLATKKTASHIAYKTMPAMMTRVFDRPTTWTKRAFYAYQPKGVLEAYVNIKDGVTRTPGRGGKIGTPAFKYLRTQIAGGRRGEKSHEKKLRALGILGPDEYTVPGDDMPLDRYGNMRRSWYSKILADVQGRDVGIDQGYGQATTKRGKKKFFYSPNLRPRGIYQRFGRGGRSLRVALLFVKSPDYRPRFDFDGIAKRVARTRFRREFNLALNRALRTAR